MSWCHTSMVAQGIREVEEWMSRTSGLALTNLLPYLFCYTDRDATEHLLRCCPDRA